MMREPFYSLLWKASIGHNDSWSQVDPEVLEKFAELIVLECIKHLDPSGDLTSMNEEFGRLNAMEMLKKHFGVK